MEQFEFIKVQEHDRCLKSLETMEGGSLKKQTNLSELEALMFEEIDSVSSEQQAKLLTNFGGLDALHLDVISPPFQYFPRDTEKFPNCHSDTSEIVEREKILTGSFSFACLTKRSTRVDGKKMNAWSYERPYSSKASDPRLSAPAIMRLAGEKFIQSSSERVNELSQISNPFACSFMGLSDWEAKDVELVQDLLSCAEKVGRKQFDSASKMIWQFRDLSFSKGNPVQRLVYHFADALLEKINREKGNTNYYPGKRTITDLLEALMSPNPGIIAFHQRLPFSQICQFTAVQTIVENVREARMVHIVDFEIRNGMQWTVLIEALAAQRSYPLQHLKITAVGTISRSKVEETGARTIYATHCNQFTNNAMYSLVTGERLKSFAQSMNMPFTFDIIMVSSILDLNIDLFEWDREEEEVAIYLPYLLSTLIVKPDHLDHLMRLIHTINPRVTVITEVEANHSSPAFVNRFIEALFYYSAFFDSLADCMADDEANRSVSEGHFSMAIHNIVADEGPERIMRHISIDIWRAFFARFRMVEEELSTISRYQADLLVQKFDRRSSPTVHMNGKSMIVGWKGSPIFSVSSWKFV